MDNLYPHLPGVPPFQGFDMWVVHSGPFNLPKRNFLAKKFNMKSQVEAAFRDEKEAKSFARDCANKAFKDAPLNKKKTKAMDMWTENNELHVAVREIHREWKVTKITVRTTND
jgi:hypothetical protein